MRGGKTCWYLPLLVAFLALLPAGCNLELKVAEPYLEVHFADTNTLYHPSNPVTLSYKFLADEPLLRCRYVLSRNGNALLGGETEPEAPGALHELILDVPDLDTPGLGEGRYRLQLVVQAERSREFVDLAFLDKSMDFFKDTQAPVAPGVDLSNSQRFTQPQSVRFIHPEWPVPLGSPVKVYYTTDGTDPVPGESGILYAGTPAPLPFDRGVVTLKAIAEDDAGNQSSIKEVLYYFAHINSIDPLGATPKPPFTVPIKVFGFGFVGATASDIRMTDANSNDCTLFINTITEPYIYISADINGAPVGPATISITVTDRGPVTVSVPFQVAP